MTLTVTPVVVTGGSAYCTACQVPTACVIFAQNPRDTSVKSVLSLSHLTDEETEAQGSGVTGLKSH